MTVFIRISRFSVLLVLLLMACNPEAHPGRVAVTAVSVNPSSADLKAGQTLQLAAMVQPGDAADKTVSWASSDATVADVDQNGLVSAFKAGSALKAAVDKK